MLLLPSWDVDVRENVGYPKLLRGKHLLHMLGDGVQ